MVFDFKPPITQLLAVIALSVQKPEYEEPTDSSELVKASAEYQAKVAPASDAKGIHLTVKRPLLSREADTLLGGEPAVPGEIVLTALGAPTPALLLAITST